MDYEGKKYTVAVIATMSAGKSTLLNAMMCDDLLPSQNEACTSTVFRIEDNDNISNHEASFIDGRKKSDWVPASKSLLADLNNKGYREIEIRGNLPNIKNSQRNSKVVFFDTPGPNNAMVDDHEKITKKIIRRADYCNLICVINSSTTGVNDEWRLLSFVKKEIKKSGKKINPIFILNQIDVLESERGESVAELVNSVFTTLREYDFENPLIIPASARLSLWIRLCLNSATRMTAKEVMGDYRGAEKIKSLFSRRFKSTLHPRLQKNLRTLLDEFIDLKNDFESGLLMSEEARDAYQVLITKSYPTPRRWIKIAGKYFRFSDLYAADRLTGIPVIETILENKLNDFDQL